MGLEAPIEGRARAREAARQIGLSSLQRADYAGAARFLEKAVELGQDDANTHRLLAHTHRRQWQKTGNMASLELAQAAFEAALRHHQNANNPYFWMDMAKMHFRFGSYEGALDLLRQLFERFSESRRWVEAPAHTHAVFAAAVLLKHLGRYTEAADYLAHVREAPPRPYDKVDVAARLLHAGRTITQPWTDILIPAAYWLCISPVMHDRSWSPASTSRWAAPKA